jgi:hypothetical protein
MVHKYREQRIGGGAMVQVDPWGKAAECERAMEIVADPERRVVLSSLRSVWVALGNRRAVLEAPEQAAQVSTIAQIHIELMMVCKNAMH